MTFEQFLEKAPLIYEKLNAIEKKVESLNCKVQVEEDEFWTINQTSAHTVLSVPTLYGLVSKGAIPVYKRGKRLYFSKLEIINWIKEGQKKTASQNSAEAELFLLNKMRNGGLSS